MTDDTITLSVAAGERECRGSWYISGASGHVPTEMYVNVILAPREFIYDIS